MWKKYLKQYDLPESFISITLGFLVIIVFGFLIYNNFVKPKHNLNLDENETNDQQQMEEKHPTASETLPTTHTVSENESLWSIAEEYYKSGYNWVTIAKENKLANPDVIYVGQKLDLPKAETITAPSEKILTGTTAPPKTYTVQKGDSLWKIAVNIYGDGYAWSKISQANNLNNPNLIHPGNVFKLP